MNKNKKLKNRNMLSSEFDNIIISEVMNALFSINLKNIIVFDFNSDQLNKMFYNNSSYMDYQIKNSSIINTNNKQV
jgi:hypothetical protein